ncbi:MAG TPA: MlaD family protein, partial [Burkholderiales bacterium]|nr:MlaD family protein [Burkholderiales bacterium]
MMTHEQKTRLGIFLMIATIFFLVMLGFFIVPKLREVGDTYFINFRKTSVSGLLLGSAVRYQGVEIGKVTRIQVNRADLDSILVYIKVQKGFPIKRDTKAVLAQALLTGVRSVDLSGGSRDSVRLESGGEIQMEHGMWDQVGDIVTNVATAANSFNNLLSKENRDRITHFLEKVDESSEMLSQVLATKRKKIEGSFDDVAKAAHEFASITENVHKISANVSDMSEKIVAHVNAAVDNFAKRFSDEELGQTIKDFR